MAAERDAMDRYIAAFLEDRIGATFSGRITGVTRFGLFVRLVDTVSGTAEPSYTVLATAPSNYLFRGVALSPVAVPEPSSAAMLVGGGLALVAISRRGWRRS